MRDVLYTAKHAVRVWRQAPLVAFMVVALTALGIAGVTALFGPLYTLVLAPLPVSRPDELVRLGGQDQIFNAYKMSFVDIERFDSFTTHVAAYAQAQAAEWRPMGTGRGLMVPALVVTPDFFETLGVVPERGRSLLGDGVGDRSVVVSQRLWRSQFKDVTDFAGASIDINGQPHRVIGVMPAGFDFPSGIDAWLPIRPSNAGLGLEVIARLRPGLSLSQASAALEKVGPPANGRGPLVQSLHAYLRGDRRSTLGTLWVVSGLFLFLACGGVANLLLARGVRRRPELMVRVALGASRRRLIRQLLIETLVLVVVGGLAGLWLSVIAGEQLVGRLAELPPSQSFMPLTIILVVSLIVVVTLVCGLAPALYATRTGARRSLIKPSEYSGHSRHSFSPREGLAAAQLTLALTLLIGTGVLARSLSAQINVPLGFTSDDVVAFSITVPPSSDRVAAEAAFAEKRGLPSDRTGWTSEAFNALRVETRGQLEAEFARDYLFGHELTAQLGALPDVTSIGVVNPTPFGSNAFFLAHAFLFHVSSHAREGRPDTGEKIAAGRGYVSPTGFDVLRISLRSGRSFTEEDVTNALAAEMARVRGSTAPGTVQVAVLNESLARQLWPRENAVGKYFDTGDGKRPPFLVVGVVSDFHWTADVPSDRPTVYLPSTRGASFAVRLRPGASVEAFSAAADRIASSLMPDVPRLDVQRLSVLVSAARRDLRMALTLLGWFAVLGTIVASLGVYSAVTLMVASRTREMGIRLALGASRATIRQLLLSRVGRLLIAFPVGWGIGWALAKQFSHLLFQVTPIDLVTYTAATAALLMATAAASIVPVLRAGSIDPAAVLRNE